MSKSNMEWRWLEYDRAWKLWRFLTLIHVIETFIAMTLAMYPRAVVGLIGADADFIKFGMFFIHAVFSLVAVPMISYYRGKEKMLRF